VVVSLSDRLDSRQQDLEAGQPLFGLVKPQFGLGDQLGGCISLAQRLLHQGLQGEVEGGDLLFELEQAIGERLGQLGKSLDLIGQAHQALRC